MSLGDLKACWSELIELRRSAILKRNCVGSNEQQKCDNAKCNNACCIGEKKLGLGA
jgi:hypothetical protein